MREFHRVLKPGGWAILQVPTTAEATVDDPTATSPEARLRAFGHPGHVRRYGPDYVDRLRNAGFQVTVDRFAREMDPRKTRRYGLEADVDGHFCMKPAPQ